MGATAQPTKVELYLVKHAQADATTSGAEPDEGRSLTTQGRSDADGFGQALAAAGLRDAVLVASTRPRALQTAELIVRHLDPTLMLEPRLAGPLDREALERILHDAGDPAVAVLVGHAASFVPLIEALTGASAGQLREGAIACVEASRPLGTGASLRWIRPESAGAPA